MATNIGDFFLVSNSVYNVTDEDYLKINLIVNAAKAFARSTHQCVYIIDYFKQNFLYVFCVDCRTFLAVQVQQFD